MELVKKNIHFNRVAKEARNQITLEEDINLPDTKEDMESIVFYNYRVIIEEVKTGEQKVHIRGKIVYSILYKSEETGRLCSMEGSIPVSEQLYMEGVGGADKVQIRPQVEDFSAGIINSRKISIQSVLELYAYVQEMYDEEITTGLEGVPCEMLQKDCDFTQLAVCKKDIFRFRESVTIPNNMPNVEDVVWSSIKVKDMEYKPLDGQLSVQGKIHIFVIYDGERESYNQMHQTVIPFSTMMECSGCNMNMMSQISFEVVDSQLHLEPDYDGEARSFSVELVMELDMKLYEMQKVSTLWDVYGIQNELNPDVRAISYDVLKEQNAGTIRVVDKINMPAGDLGQAKIVYTDGKSVLEKCEVTEEGIVLNGMLACQMLYSTGTGENEYSNRQFMIPFAKVIEFPDSISDDKKNITCNVLLNCSDMQSAFDMEGNLEVKADVTYNALVFENQAGRNIVDIDISEMDMEKYNSLPSMAICFVKQGDTLWDMGKKYCVPIKQIREMNQISSDEMKAGEKILIVRGMGR